MNQQELRSERSHDLITAKVQILFLFTHFCGVKEGIQDLIHTQARAFTLRYTLCCIFLIVYIIETKYRRSLNIGLLEEVLSICNSSFQSGVSLASFYFTSLM